MRYLPLEHHDDMPIYRAAARGSGFAELPNIEDELEERFATFRASVGQFASMLPAGPPIDENQVELGRLYTSRVREVLAFKNALRQRFGVGCPYCGESCTLSQIDHYLPKSIFGEYSLFSPNLIPTCPACNLRFGNVVATRHDLIYPFADAFLAASVLRAHFNWTAEIFSIELQVEPSITGVERERVADHLRRMNIDERFKQSATSELIRYCRLFQGRSLRLIKLGLGKIADSYVPSPGPNAWPAVVARAALTDSRMMRWIRDSI